MDKELSDYDIKRAFDGKINVISYPDLRHFSSIEQVLKPYGKCVILYLTSPHQGHWIIVLKYPRKNIIEVFDPYGKMPDLGPLKPDEELAFIDEDTRLQLGMGRPYLSMLLENYAAKKGRVEYNNYSFQKWENGINTCGRWCITRGFLEDMDLPQFAKFMLNRRNPDKFITDFTNKII